MSQALFSLKSAVLKNKVGCYTQTFLDIHTSKSVFSKHNFFVEIEDLSLKEFCENVP